MVTITGALDGRIATGRSLAIFVSGGNVSDRTAANATQNPMTTQGPPHHKNAYASEEAVGFGRSGCLSPPQHPVRLPAIRQIRGPSAERVVRA